MVRRSSLPPIGFLILGFVSGALSTLFVIRAAAVDATAERVGSAALLGVFGLFWLAAYWSATGTLQG